MNLDDEKEFLNDYATRSLLYTADQDYISARASYKASLIEPFLWSSLHAIEKYLKAILLFNAIEKTRKPYGHNIIKLLDVVKGIDGIDLRLPKEAQLFMQYLSHFGANRYFDADAMLEEFALDKLDSTVWYIRRHCYDLDIYEGRGLKEIPPEIQEENPKRYRLPDGFLEKVIKDKLEANYYLSWDNWFYGDNIYVREEIREKQNKFSSINPALSFYGKEAFDILDRYVFFTRETKDYFNNQ